MPFRYDPAIQRLRPLHPAYLLSSTPARHTPHKPRQRMPHGRPSQPANYHIYLLCKPI